MLKNYLKVTLRNLWKQKVPTLINVFGLALGMACSILIFFIVQFELSFDNFHEKRDRIYRITNTSEFEGKTFYRNTVPKPLPEAFRQDFGGDIDGLLVIDETSGRLKLDGETVFLKERQAFTENAYFHFFDCPLIAGNLETVLQQPNEVVLTEALSVQLFGSADKAMGKTFTFMGNTGPIDLEVTGILQDLPENTDFTYGMLISDATQNKENLPGWDSYNSSFNVFVLLPEKVNPASYNQRLDAFFRKYANVENIDKYKAKLHLQPLTDLHYDENYGGFPSRKISKSTLTGLTLLAGILLLLGCVNFVNLATAISTKRNKEIGIRKTLGSSSRQVVMHFLGEAFIITVLATLLALGLAEAGLMQLKKLYPYLDQVHLHFNFTSVIFLAVLILIVTHLAGLYPGWVLSRFRPVQLFKPTVVTVQRRSFSLRQILVVFQFFVAQVFIACTLIIAQQMDFLKNAPLGFDEQAIITVDLRDVLPQTRDRFKSMLSNESGVEAINFSMSSAISQSMWSSDYKMDGTAEYGKQVYFQFADDQFFETHGMKLLAGQVYTSSDSGSGFVANEAFVHELGLEHPEQALGKYISVWNFNLPIVGVVADYHANGFTSKIGPMLITNFSPQYHTLNVRVNMEQANTVISKLEKIWKITYPEFAFHYEFLDDRVDSFYKDYDRNYSLAQIFAGIAIFIGCLGLFGLVMFMAERKTKEIGIRKVLGASVQHILGLFSKEFVRLILIAFTLATPLAYYAMQRWLENFAYSIEISFPVFLWCLLVTLLLVLFTVGYQSIRAALANPVNSLRDE